MSLRLPMGDWPDGYLECAGLLAFVAKQTAKRVGMIIG